MKKKLNACYCRRQWLEKMLRVMKIGFFLLVLSLTTVHATTLTQKKVTLDVKDKSLLYVLDLLQEQSEYTFLFSSEDVRNVANLSVKADNENVFDVLKRCLKGTNLSFEINGQLVVLRLQSKATEAYKKMLRVKGFVHDEKKQPMPGVTVKVVGVSVGTATNDKGWFAMDLPLLKGKLEFSFIGYKSQQVDFTDKTDTLRIVLKEDVADLDEVVVRAYGTQKKREVVSAISTVTAEEMKELPAASITSMLQGRLAGVNIIQQSGAPGSAAVVAVRGFNSLLMPGASGGQPLWVVDGVPMHSFVSPVTGTNTLADLDPSMIESVQVLKDAAAASIYGSRAGNGVILVTTKRGKEGKTLFTGNVSYSISQLMEWPTQTGGRMERWLDVRNLRNKRSGYYVAADGVSYYPTSYEEVWETNGLYDSFWGSGKKDVNTIHYYQDSLDPYYNNVKNWWKHVFRTGEVLNANVQASGGTDKLQYMVGVGYYKEDGIMINSVYSRLNLKSNLTANLTKRLRMDTRIYLSYMDKSMNKSGTGGNYEGMPATPSRQLTYIAGSKEMEDEWLKNIKDIRDLTDDYRLMSSIFFEYKLWKGLSFSASGNVDYSHSNMNQFTPSTFDSNHHENISQGAVSRTVTISTEELLRYNASFNEKHNVDILIGVNANKEQNFYIGGWGRGGASDYVSYYDPDKNSDVVNYGTAASPNWSSLTSYRSDFTEKVMVSYFGRFGYNYKQRYLVEFTFRRDGSSTFGEGNRWANFPSVAAGWTFSEEPFIKQFTGKWLNWGKIRGSYGTSGQIFTDAYLAHGLMTIPDNKIFQGNPMIESAVPISPSLTWEKTEQYDLGLDMDMFNYRLNVKLDYYYKYTSSLIYGVGLPGTLYVHTNRTENSMELSNQGLELELQADILRESALSWRMKFNAARNWNRFEKSNNGKDVGNAYVIGRPLYGMYVYASEGMYQSEDEVPRYYTTNGVEKYINGLSPGKGVSGLVGTQNIKDLDGSGKIQSNDLYYAGSPLPLAHGGWVNELRWKDFDLNMLISYSIGRKMRNSRVSSLNVDGPKFLDYRELDYWAKPGDDADLPHIGTNVNSRTDAFIEKVHSMSLKQLTLGYNLSDKIAGKMGISGMRFFVTGENLFYWSNYSGENPEVVDIYSGVDLGTNYPLPRKWTLGLTVNF